MSSDTNTSTDLARENEDLRARLREAEAALQAIRNGEVDAVFGSRNGGRIYALEESDTVYRHMIENMRQGALLLLEDGGIYYCNGAFARMLCQPLEQVIGSSIFTWVHPDGADAMRILLERGCVRGGEAEVRFLNAEGADISTLASASPLHCSGTRGICLAVTDLGEIQALEQALEALSTSEARLFEANEALAAADHSKDDFLATLAHELRNPLSPIRTAVSILQLVGAHNPVLWRQIATIERQVAHMTRLLDDLLDVERITQGKIILQCRPVVLADILIHAMEEVTPRIQMRRQVLNFNPPPDDLLVTGDQVRLDQIVGNLLINASKYTEERGQIWLEAVGEGGQAVIRVRDTGMGIAPDMLQRIFEPYAQAERTLDRAQGGLGIGLTLARKLVELHGGTLTPHSAGLGCGSEFTVRLPALARSVTVAPATVLATELVAAPPPAPRRVLVVDDDVDSANSMAELLGLWGHDVRETHDGPAALEAARAWLPELVLLDIGLPGMNGFEVARCLRAGFGQALLLVAMTGYGQDQDRDATQAAGFNYHLVKPVDLNALQDVLHRL